MNTFRSLVEAGWTEGRLENDSFLAAAWKKYVYDKRCIESARLKGEKTPCADFSVSGE
jgi:hypothetical protein